MKSNKKLGSDFEQEVCQELAQEGYWVHNVANRKNGQPMDIIAVRENIACLIDAKVCTNGIFKISRIEENQVLSMRRWFQTGNNLAMLWLRLPDETVSVIVLNSEKELDELLGQKTLNEAQIRQLGFGQIIGRKRE